MEVLTIAQCTECTTLPQGDSLVKTILVSKVVWLLAEVLKMILVSKVVWVLAEVLKRHFSILMHAV